MYAAEWGRESEKELLTFPASLFIPEEKVKCVSQHSNDGWEEGGEWGAKQKAARSDRAIYLNQSEVELREMTCWAWYAKQARNSFIK